MFKQVLHCVSAVLLSSCAPAELGGESESKAASVDYARGEESSAHPEAGFLTHAGAPGDATCSATVIPPGNRVLTARHCVDKAERRNNLRFGLGAVAGDPNADYYDVTSVAPYGSGDLAVLTLNRHTPHAGIPVRPTPPPVGTRGEVAGYGYGNEDAPTGRKRLAPVEVGPGNSSTFNIRDPLVNGVCPGDSGSGVIADVGNGREIIGVTYAYEPGSRSRPWRCHSGQGGIIQRVDGADRQNFINNAQGSAPSAVCAQANESCAQSTTYVPGGTNRARVHQCCHPLQCRPASAGSTVETCQYPTTALPPMCTPPGAICNTHGDCCQTGGRRHDCVPEASGVHRCVAQGSLIAPPASGQRTTGQICDTDSDCKPDSRTGVLAQCLPSTTHGKVCSLRYAPGCSPGTGGAIQCNGPPNGSCRPVADVCSRPDDCCPVSGFQMTCRVTGADPQKRCALGNRTQPSGGCYPSGQTCDPNGVPCCGVETCTQNPSGWQCSVPQTQPTPMCIGVGQTCTTSGPACCSGQTCTEFPGGWQCASPPGGSTPMCVPQGGSCNPLGAACCDGASCQATPGGFQCAGASTDSTPMCVSRGGMCNPSGPPCCTGQSCQLSGGAWQCTDVAAPAPSCLSAAQQCNPTGATPCCNNRVCRQLPDGVFRCDSPQADPMPPSSCVNGGEACSTTGPACCGGRSCIEFPDGQYRCNTEAATPGRSCISAGSAQDCATDSQCCDNGLCRPDVFGNPRCAPPLSSGGCATRGRSCIADDECCSNNCMVDGTCGSPAASNPDADPNPRCGGSCLDVNTYSCLDGFQSGLCSGGSNIQCCNGTSVRKSVEEAGRSGLEGSVSSCSGTCLNTGSYECLAGFQSNRCPGSSSFQCCPGAYRRRSSGGSESTPEPAPSGGSRCSGECIDTNRLACSVATQTGRCAGPTAVKCCPGRSYDPGGI